MSALTSTPSISGTRTAPLRRTLFSAVLIVLLAVLSAALPVSALAEEAVLSAFEAAFSAFDAVSCSSVRTVSMSATL